MEIKQLEAFVHVAELGSFTRAAITLDTNQPALSRLVRHLEVELRHTLLERNGRGVTLTPAGQRMLSHAKGILQQVQRASQDLDELRGALGGHFGIGITPSFASVATHELVRRFRTAFPGATISVAQGLSTYLIEWLMMGRIDAAVLYDTFDTPSIDKRTVFTEELFLIGADNGASNQTLPEQIAEIPLRQIARYPLVIPGRMHAIRRMVESAAAEQGVRLRIELEVDAVTSILDLVSEGIGYAVLSLNATISDALKRRFKVIRITEPTLYSRLAIATSRKHPLSQLAIQAIAMLEANIVPLYGHTP
ncbi:LysR family transcriptional regulator [Trinickia caryophylli]|uniref:LysR family transcriptional regulator, nitrogen assimilation regulatory protein n=1 Tax=Trinickia caryophylli TaxID=28094 RepID=A0A1X7GJX9_TRICW|nr:LysR family transcriptional regulator [Trinickia caryophylli]PMS09133.1 LysR family transcriptional regulator [Trinickia caryophylli]TRX15449.1 LysR family transcriptional regulator [Trinickia caryophylli]WQE15639.1 LysR family transcriptional regulator [Trinickia caryophylli]SMF70867.1 LysR family transcriptional regulator, nitrogen assimilation regulatory protein [Trinickia caryophylli]GLU35032.1 LysR family transcriptional regulator [Trinickia caryophylli]